MQLCRIGNMVKILPQFYDTFYSKEIKNKDLQNKYTRKQPTHFSIASFNQKKFFQNQTNHKFRTPKKMTFKSRAKTKPPFP